MAAPAARPPATLMGDSGLVFVVTGPSGAGKGTLIRALLERIPELEVAVSATTRAQRPGEVDGGDYWFLSDEEFTRRVEEGGFLEWVEYVSHKRYGTLRSELERRLRERATESTGEIEDRITLARYQLEQAHRFRYMVRNDDVVRASEVRAAIVERELALAAAGSSVSGGSQAERA